MTKKEKELLLNSYKESYQSYIFGYAEEKEVIRLLNTLLLVLDEQDIIKAELEAIFEDQEYPLDRWQQICNYMAEDLQEMNKLYRLDKIEIIKEEVHYTSDNKEMIEARKRTINKFMKRIKNLDLKINILS